MPTESFDAYVAASRRTRSSLLVLLVFTILALAVMINTYWLPWIDSRTRQFTLIRRLYDVPGSPVPRALSGIRVQQSPQLQELARSWADHAIQSGMVDRATLRRPNELRDAAEFALVAGVDSADAIEAPLCANIQ